MAATKIVFNDGKSIPTIGLGTWLSKPGEVHDAVCHGLSCGYRHIDCAFIYGNEGEIGEAIKAKIQDGTVKREEIFITSKLWLTFFRKDLVIPTLKEQLKTLGLEYLDLYLLHWAMSFKEEIGKFPVDDKNMTISGTADYMDTWAELEKAQKLGLVRSIGVSNFSEKQMQRILSEGKIVPVVNQVECHPYLNQRSLIDFCESKGVKAESYMTLGNPGRPFYDPNIPEVMKDPLILSLANKYSKDAGQICIRFQIQRGVIALVKSVKKERIQSNLQVYDFELSGHEMESLEGLNRDLRYNVFARASNNPNYPF